MKIDWWYVKGALLLIFSILLLWVGYGACEVAVVAYITGQMIGLDKKD